MSKEDLWISVQQIGLKTLLPSFVTVMIGVAVEYNRTKELSFVQVLLSMVIGMGTAYLFHEWIHASFTDNGHASLMVSVITMASYKIWELLVIFINKTSISDVIGFLSKLK